jgi:hypothetical protein
VLSNLEQTNAQSLRDSIIQSRISALENVDSINKAKQSALLSNYSTLSGLTNPSLQYSSISTTDPNTALQNMSSAQQKTASTTPISGEYGANQATGNVTQAASGASKYTPDSNASSETVQSIGKSVSDLTQNSDVQALLSKWLGGGTSKNVPSTDTAASPSGLQQTFGVGSDQLVP